MGDLSCERFAELVGEHVEDVLSGDERAAMERHLGTCEPCRRLRREYAGVGEAVRRATDVRMPPGARSRLRRLLARVRQRS